MATRPDATDLLHAVDLARHRQRNTVDLEHQATMGQYLTPPSTALRMAAMFRLPQRTIRVLDPGAGAGALTAALVATLASRTDPPGELDLTAIELDPLLLPALRETLAACEAVARAHGIACSWRVVEGDYVSLASHALEAGFFSDSMSPKYEAVILNPPYKKIGSESAARRLLERAGLLTTNLYAGFVGMAVAQLSDGGEYVAITPRSWCNGSYFAPFRRWLLERSSLADVHIYGRRDAAFSDDGVLTESVIYHGVRGAQSEIINISESTCPDTPNSAERRVPFSQVVIPNDPFAFVHLTTEDVGHEAAELIRALPCTLATLGLQVSTGRVVDFRARTWLSLDPLENGSPLIYPMHFGQPRIVWPKLGAKKPNALAVGVPDDLLIPAGYYTLVKRFSSKEERRRIVASVYDPEYIPGRRVGIENHLNYFHALGRPLDARLAYGLAAYLNSDTVDIAFRQFSGHTQVNATDLRMMRYPSLRILRAAGAAILSDRLSDAIRLIDDCLRPLALGSSA